MSDDRVEELGRVEEIGDHIQADAFKEIIKTGQGFDRLRRGDVLVVGRDARGDGVGGCLIERAAGRASRSGLGA